MWSRSRVTFPSEIKKRFPYMETDDLEGGSLGIRHEGTLDAFSLMQGLKLRARHNGVEYLNNRVASINVDKSKGKCWTADRHIFRLGFGKHKSSEITDGIVYKTSIRSNISTPYRFCLAL